MTLAASFTNALTGLRVSNRMTEVASNNIANALTDGYARQDIHVSSVALNGQGVGARVATISRAEAPEYTPARRQADADAAEHSAIADAMARIGLMLGEADAEDGLFRRIESFETALRHLAETGDGLRGFADLQGELGCCMGVAAVPRIEGIRAMTPLQRPR